MRLLDEPNAYGCHNPQCYDSTWDHDCPTVPDDETEDEFDELAAAGEPVMVVGARVLESAAKVVEQDQELLDRLAGGPGEEPQTRGVGWCAPSP